MGEKTFEKHSELSFLRTTDLGCLLELKKRGEARRERKIRLTKRRSSETGEESGRGKDESKGSQISFLEGSWVALWINTKKEG